ncbi:hypothetical protein PGTUg99_001089 [Puccinia graminis f. sp. tritici]|uniref:Uncharacterized protein n=1 Tax=Puccinia graminis f. sp. tritici TaxID=56615 RepID=A0A5B0NW06_PUCGR|nr:hypothetical protein PGTUg99_001089 [Puccinia graminis f. sp. tritici]
MSDIPGKPLLRRLASRGALAPARQPGPTNRWALCNATSETRSTEAQGLVKHIDRPTPSSNHSFCEHFDNRNETQATAVSWDTE